MRSVYLRGINYILYFRDLEIDSRLLDHVNREGIHLTQSGGNWVLLFPLHAKHMPSISCFHASTMTRNFFCFLCCYAGQQRINLQFAAALMSLDHSTRTRHLL